jgi:hypothetical protein
VTITDHVLYSLIERDLIYSETKKRSTRVSTHKNQFFLNKFFTFQKQILLPLYFENDIALCFLSSSISYDE